MKKLLTGAIIMATTLAANAAELQLVQEWDKTFPKSDKVEHCKATFKNRFGISLAADVYKPKEGNEEWGTGNGRAVAPRPPKFAAIAVSGPFGAVKEQVSGRYAQGLAERGFLTIAFDPSYTGESGGEPRNINSPDINTEDFQAAVDYLVSRDAKEEFEREEWKSLLKSLGVEGEWEGIGHCAVGYAAKELPAGAPRKSGRVVWA